MNKYNVGDLVMVKRDLAIGKHYGGSTCTEFLSRCAGKEGRIVDMVCHKGEYYYQLLLGFQYWFNEQMLEAVEGKSVKFPRYDVSDMLNDLVALMSKYGIDTFNIEQSEGLMTFTFTKEV